MKKIIVISTLVILVICLVVGLVIFTKNSERKEASKNSSDASSIKDANQEATDYLNKQRQACRDYIANGGSKLDKNWIKDCSNIN